MQNHFSRSRYRNCTDCNVNSLKPLQSQRGPLTVHNSFYLVNNFKQTIGKIIGIPNWNGKDAPLERNGLNFFRGFRFALRPCSCDLDSV